MASGDTKTEALLNILGNGGDASQYKGCCNTKTQQYILDAIDRIDSLDPGGGSTINVVQTTGTSTTDVMSQNAVTEALANVAQSTIRELTRADYNWNFKANASTDQNDCISIGALPYGIYMITDLDAEVLYSNGYQNRGTIYSANSQVLDNPNFYKALIIKTNSGGLDDLVYAFSNSFITNSSFAMFLMRKTSGNAGQTYTGAATIYGLWSNSIIDNLTSTSTTRPLSAAQGKVLKDMIDAHAGGFATELTSSNVNYDYNNSGVNNAIALWKLPKGFYYINSGLTVPVFCFREKSMDFEETPLEIDPFHCNSFTIMVAGSMDDPTGSYTRSISVKASFVTDFSNKTGFYEVWYIIDNNGLMQDNKIIA